MGSRIPTRLSCTLCDVRPKADCVAQHTEPFALQLFPEPESLEPHLRTGVVEAVTLLAKAIAATKETRVLENNIVKDV